MGITLTQDCYIVLPEIIKGAGVVLKLRQPVSFYARRNESHDAWDLSCGLWGLGPYLVSQVELLREVTEDILMLWDEYALSDDDTLAPGAQELKQQLLACFEPA